MRRVIGITLLVLLFGGLFGAGVVTAGWQDTLLGFGLTIVIIAIVVLAVYLIDDQDVPRTSHAGAIDFDSKEFKKGKRYNVQTVVTRVEGSND